tara:strand:+ start:68 stop:787 length:720 start_codon:yes stop_codon:yes gene_type:complete
MDYKNKYISGFTLVEMLISITILSLVTSSMFLMFNSVQKKFNYNRTVSNLNSYAKGVFLYLDETISAAEGNDIVQDGNGSYRIDFTNIHNEWYNGNGDYFVDRDKCELENGCVIYTACREICKKIPITWDSDQGVKFNNIPIWKYADFRGKPFNDEDPMSLSEYQFLDFNIQPLDQSGDPNYSLTPDNGNKDNWSDSVYLITMKIAIDNNNTGYFGNNKKQFFNFEHRVFSPTILASGI